MRIVSNTSPLIFLAKIDCLGLLDDYEVLIPNAVKEEVAKGKEREIEDAYLLEKRIREGKIRIKQAKLMPLLKTANIDRGERETIELAKQENIVHVLLDERKARNIAKSLGLKPHGTIWVMFQAFKHGAMSRKQLEGKIFDLIERGYRIKEDLLIEILREIHED